MSEKKALNENSRMTSIAKRIKMDYWLNQLGNFIFLNIAIFIIVFAAYINYKNIPFDIDIIDAQIFKDIWKIIRVPSYVLFGVEAAVMIGDLFGKNQARLRLRAVNDIAIKAEELSTMSFDDTKFDDIEQAINEMNPDMPDAKVTTGDKDLQSLEIAINNLVQRMRESPRQQERFVSDASHELRTPISVIQGYVNMLDRWGKEDEHILDESIEAIKNESEHMKTLIEQLLFLARGDNGRNTLKFVDFDMTELVRDVYEESVMIDEKHRYAFTSNGTVTAKGDMAMIKQSLRILVQNAAKYSDSDALITLSADIVDGRPAYKVQDEGIGMADTEVGHVFERFYRSDSARNSAEGGTGLGLSIAKWIVDAHKGNIEVLSRPEFGTRFTVKL